MAKLGQATILVLVSLVIMIIGINLIGASEHYELATTGNYVIWHLAELEWGIFITIIGTLALAGSSKILWVALREDTESRPKAEDGQSPHEEQ